MDILDVGGALHMVVIRGDIERNMECYNFYKLGHLSQTTAPNERRNLRNVPMKIQFL